MPGGLLRGLNGGRSLVRTTLVGDLPPGLRAASRPKTARGTAQTSREGATLGLQETGRRAQALHGSRRLPEHDWKRKSREKMTPRAFGGTQRVTAGTAAPEAWGREGRARLRLMTGQVGARSENRTTARRVRRRARAGRSHHWCWGCVLFGTTLITQQKRRERWWGEVHEMLPDSLTASGRAERAWSGLGPRLDDGLRESMCECPNDLRLPAGGRCSTLSLARDA